MEHLLNSKVDDTKAFFSLNEEEISVELGTNSKDVKPTFSSKELDLADDKEPAYDTHNDMR